MNHHPNKQAKREQAVRNEYKSIRRETIAKRHSSLASHREYQQHLASIISTSKQFKTIHNNQQQALINLELKATLDQQRNERAAQLRHDAAGKVMNIKCGPLGKSGLSRQINSNHKQHDYLEHHDQGEYLDDKLKVAMTAPDRQLWSHPNRGGHLPTGVAKHWYPSSNIRPQASQPFSACPPLSSFPDSDYEERLRGIKKGNLELNNFTHQEKQEDLGELSTYDKDGDGDIDEEEMKTRTKQWVAPPLKYTRGTMHKYIKTVASAALGCVTDE
jgi:hypothetical protein